MDKVLTFSTHDTLGRCFAEAIDIMPRSGGGIEKVAGELHPEIKRYLRTLRPDPRYQYVLMTPMGAYEYWGMNVNGDVFPEISLAHCFRNNDPEPVIQELVERFLKPFGKSLPPFPLKEFGFRTFEQAHRYKHHVNKNPEIAYGDISFVIYNPYMHRVELVSRHDREKAKRVGAEEIIRDLDNGKPRQISMGCRVPFDVCTICGHVSKSPRDYCVHLRSGMGTVQDDGKMVGAVNFFPRFFDLSDVFVPAAKESGVLMKVASAQPFIPVSKTAGIKKAEMTKKILPNAISETLMRLRKSEPDLPKAVLMKDPQKLIGTTSGLGMVLKPREFQYSMLNRMGKRNLAESLMQKNQVFDSSISSQNPVHRLSSSDYSPSLARILSKMLPLRSFFSPHLPERSVKITVIKVSPKEPEVLRTPMLNKIAAAYSDYRNSIRTLPSVIDTIIGQDQGYFTNNFFSDILEDDLTKVASFHKISSEELINSYMFNIYCDNIKMTPKGWLHNIPSNSIAQSLFGRN